MTLMAAAETELARRGGRPPWLACGIGNDRAARFYQKAGWRNAGKVPYGSVTSGGKVEVMVWRFERGGHRRKGALSPHRTSILAKLVVFENANLVPDLPNNTPRRKPNNLVSYRPFLEQVPTQEIEQSTSGVVGHYQ
jgi:hypothetical protein